MRVRVNERRKEQSATAVLPEGMERLMGIVDVASLLGVPVATVRSGTTSVRDPSRSRLGGM